MKLRNLIFWSHLVTGLVIGLVILVMALTGLLLSFEKPVTLWVERGLPPATMPAHAQHLGPEALLAQAAVARPGVHPVSITIRSDVTQPVMVGFGKEGALLLDPFSGKAREISKARGFFRSVEDIHRRLAMGAFGQNITGIVVVAFLFMVLSGLFLWIPRTRARWTRNALRTITFPDLGLSGKARAWSLHNSVGLWSSPLLLVTVITGTVMAHPWATDLLYRATGNTPPPRPTNNPPGKEAAAHAGESHRMTLHLDGLDRLWMRAESEAPGWQSITLRLPGTVKFPLGFQIDQSDGNRPDKRFQLNIDAKTGEVTSSERFQDYNMGRKLRLWMRPIHTGDAFGYYGCIIGALVSFSTVLLIWTGISMACRRFFARKMPVTPV